MDDAVRLLLIDGPVAAGKTSLAWELAARIRAEGGSAASIDMDELTEMIGGTDWRMITAEHRQQGCALAAALVDRITAQGTDLIAIAGSTLSPYEWRSVLDQATAAVAPTFIRLRVSIPEATRRASADPTRVLTRDPEVVKLLHTAIDWDATERADLEVDTERMTTDEVVKTVMTFLLEATE